MDWVVDRTGISYVVQEISPDNLRLLRVNGQHSQGEVLGEGIKCYETMYAAHSGVWLTNGATVDGTEFTAKFCSAETSATFTEENGDRVKFCQSWTRENLILLCPDAESPGQSIVKECQPNGEVRCWTNHEGVSGVHQCYIPAVPESIIDFCADGDRAVIFLCQLADRPGCELRRAEWRFQKKFELVQEYVEHCQLVSDGYGGGVWLLKKGNGVNRNLSFMDRAGAVVDSTPLLSTPFSASDKV